MGHGASVTKEEDFHSLFCTQEIIDGNTCMVEDEYVRQAFILFLKNGMWKEHFSKYFRMEEYIVLSLELLAREKICIVNDYLLPRDEIGEFRLLRGAETALIQEPTKYDNEKSMRSTRSSRGVDTVVDASQGPVLKNCEVDCFTASQCAAILFSSLYPMFLATTDCESIADVRSFGGSTIDDCDGFHIDDLRPTAQLLHPQRSTELIIDTTSCFSERDLLEEVQNETWAASAGEAFDESSLCLSIVDTLAPVYPIVYANKAFLALTGHTERSLLGTSYEVLSGVDTEKSQHALLNEAICQSKSARIGLTQYTRRRKPFFALVSVKAAGRYAVCNHFSTAQPLHINELKVCWRADRIIDGLCGYILRISHGVFSSLLSFSFSFGHCICIRWRTTCCVY